MNKVYYNPEGMKEGTDVTRCPNGVRCMGGVTIVGSGDCKVCTSFHFSGVETHDRGGVYIECAFNERHGSDMSTFLHPKPGTLAEATEWMEKGNEAESPRHVGVLMKGKSFLYHNIDREYVMCAVDVKKEWTLLPPEKKEKEAPKLTEQQIEKASQMHGEIEDVITKYFPELKDIIGTE
jgi:hypothetical protein